MKRRLALLLAIILMLSLLSISASATKTANIAADSRSSVVRIIAIGETFKSKGSGFAVGIEGQSTDIFITNHHVVEDSLECYIALDNDWEKSVPAFGGKNDNVHAVKCEIVYTTSGTPDYAILRAAREITERKAIPLMKSHLAFPGDTIYVLGYPGVADDIEDNISADIDSVSITRGTISRFTVLESEKSKAIQIDADVNKGNSGGPLITEQGNVIGINTWYWAEGDAKICLSLEIDYVIDKLNELITDGTLRNFEFTLISEPVENPTEETQPTEKETEPEREQDEDPDEETEEEPNDEPEKEPAASSAPTSLIWLAIAMAGCALAAVLFMKNRAPEPQNAPVAAAPQPGLSSEAASTAPQNIVYQRTGMEFRIVGVRGQFAGKRIALDRELRLGRNPNGDLIFPVNTPGISTTHCSVTPQSDCVLLTDLGSTYGTFLANGTKLVPHQSVPLKSGDSFYLADSRQTFLIDHKRR